MEDRSSDVISAISTNSKIRMRFTIFVGSVALGLIGPGVFRDMERVEGRKPRGSFRLDAASAPLEVNSGRLGSLVESPSLVGVVYMVIVYTMRVADQTGVGLRPWVSALH